MRLHFQRIGATEVINIQRFARMVDHKQHRVHAFFGKQVRLGLFAIAKNSEALADFQ